MIELCYVIDSRKVPLSPTNYNNGYRLIRKGKAKMISKMPFVIQLTREQDNTDLSQIIGGVDTGALYTGIGLMQECKTKNKIIFKGTINHPQDVKKKMELRKGYRRYRRSHKRYRKARFNNRASSKRLGRLPNSIKCNKDEIIRVLDKLSNFIKLSKVIIEDVQIDIRRLTDGKLYSWQYQKSNRLDENLRKATLMRDNHTCKMCGIKNVRLEAHHVIPRKYNGMDSLNNLITLCHSCHDKVTGKEMEYSEMLYKMINGKNIRFDYSQRAMQGKTYLRQTLECLYEVDLTYGSDTANKRIDWGIKKSHSNDALCCNGLKFKDIDFKDWIIFPLRKKGKAVNKSIFHIKHRDIIKYTKKDKSFYIGYVISIDNLKKSCSFVDKEGNQYKRYGIKSCKLLQRNKSINFI